MANFDAAFSITMGHEGRYSNDPDDPGRETFMGISRVYNPSWSGWKVIDQLKKEVGFPGNLNRSNVLKQDVRDFYKARYWDGFWGDRILHQKIANEMFDTGVNLGMSRAVIFLQTGLNALNRDERLYKDLDEDGEMGPSTFGALQKLCKSTPDGSVLLKILNVLQGSYYISRMRRSTRKEKYARGWFKRVDISKI
jgi:lysozyme family protein